MNPPTIRQIIHTVARAYDIDPSRLLSRRRGREIVRPRQVAMWIAMRTTDQSYPIVARLFGRDHTTVMHAVKVVEIFRERDSDFREKVDRLAATCARTGASGQPDLAFDLIDQSLLALRRRLRVLARQDPNRLITSLKLLIEARP